jgi:hypothetical protein
MFGEPGDAVYVVLVLSGIGKGNCGDLLSSVKFNRD